MYLPPYIRDIHGTVFPPSPIERELFYRDDLHIWYIYDGTAWVSLLTGMIIHGNAWHAPAFATAAALLAHIAATGAPIHGSSVAAAINTLIHRDAAGRAQIANPAANPDIDNMLSRNAAIAVHAALTAAGIHGSTVAATFNRLIHRDAAGRSQIVNPAVAADIDNLGARDAAIVLAIAIHAALTTGIHGVGASTVDSVAARIAAIAAHAGLTTGVHGAGANHLALAPAVSHLVRTFTKGWTANKLLKGAGVNVNPTEINIGTGANDVAAGNHTHSLDDDTSGSGVSGTATGGAGTEYEYTKTMPSHAYWTIASTTPNFQAGSLAFGAASFHGRGSTFTVLKLVLGGVTVATSGGMGAADHVLCVKGFRALSGAQLCRARIYNSHVSTRYVYTYAHYSAVRLAGAIAVGSVKFV